MFLNEFRSKEFVKIVNAKRLKKKDQTQKNSNMGYQVKKNDVKKKKKLN